jgi:hypothetical protein
VRTGDGVEFDVGGIDVAMSVEVSRSVVVVRAGAVAVVVAVIIDVTNSILLISVSVPLLQPSRLSCLKQQRRRSRFLPSLRKSTEKIKKFECYGF